MPWHYWSFKGHVDDAGGGIVTIVVDRATDSYPIPGDEVQVAVRHVEPEHDHDWRWDMSTVGRLDRLASVRCAIDGCGESRDVRNSDPRYMPHYMGPV